MPSQSTPVLILGGGISGLSVGYFLKKKGIPFTLLETSERCGGVIQSKNLDGNILEFGPNSIRDKTGLIVEMAKSIGLEAELISVSEAFKTRYIAKDGKLEALKSNPLSILGTKLLSGSAKFRAFTEYWRKPESVPEESVGAFIERRFGKEISTWLADPVFTGVYAGDVYNLDKKLILKEIASYEEDYGSVLKGVFKAPKGEKQKPLVFSFSKGIQQLTDALSEFLKDSVQHEEVKGIEKTPDGYSVKTNAGKWEAAKVISTLPSHVLAEVLQSLDLNLSQALSSIKYAPVAGIHLVFEQSGIQIPDAGFGFLVPSAEKKKLLGAIWRSAIFPSLTNSGQLVFTLLTGGVHHQDIREQFNDQWKDEVINDFKEYIGIKIDPIQSETYLWKKAIPQFEVGYSKVISQIEEFEKNSPNLHIGGNFRWGVSVPDCVQGASSISSII